MTVQIADAIDDALRPQGGGVVIRAEHHCMTTPGVHKPGTELVTTRLLGCFTHSAVIRHEFLEMAA